MRLLAYHARAGAFWFRVLGVGVAIEDRGRHPAPLCERYGLAPAVRVGRWSIRWLPRMP